MSGDIECEECIGLYGQLQNYSSGNLSIHVEPEGIELNDLSPFAEAFLFLMVVLLAFVICLANGGRQYYAEIRARRAEYN